MLMSFREKDHRLDREGGGRRGTGLDSLPRPNLYQRPLTEEHVVMLPEIRVKIKYFPALHGN